MIPIVINNFNRLKTTQALVYRLIYLGYTDIHILDNCSDYAPLLSWYEHLNQFIFKDLVHVEKLCTNSGPLAIYNSGYMEKLKDNPWVAYTDSDLELNPNTPHFFIDELLYIAEKYGAHKVGLALQTDDLPDNEYAQYYKNWEKRFWVDEVEPNVYKGEVDTTFCIIKPSRPFGYEAYRVGGQYTAKHIPWYTDFDNLDEEEQHYLNSSSRDSTYKRYYENHINKAI